MYTYFTHPDLCAYTHMSEYTHYTCSPTQTYVCTHHTQSHIYAHTYYTYVSVYTHARAHTHTKRKKC